MNHGDISSNLETVGVAVRGGDAHDALNRMVVGRVDDEFGERPPVRKSNSISISGAAARRKKRLVRVDKPEAQA
jgi:hypothetical protein